MATEVIRLSKDNEPVLRPDKDLKKLLEKKSDEELLSNYFLGKKTELVVQPGKRRPEKVVSEYSAAERDAITSVLVDRQLYPEKWTRERELKSGLYPDIQDPHFGVHLYNKQEFYEARSAAITAMEGNEPCNRSVESVFEISPIQKLVSRFLNPLTPYHGLLLFHGVGVGKTCSAVRVAEEYLKQLPYSKVFIVVPQAIATGFRKTIFDASKLRLVDGAWTSSQCTGMTYPDMALKDLAAKGKPGQEFSAEEISDLVEKKIRDRYFRFGYLQFANWILRQLKATVPSHLEDDERERAENAQLAKMFSDKLVIIDEAHNLRDSAGQVADTDLSSEEEDADEEDPAAGGDDQIGGKRLTPLLKRIAKFADGLRLLLMTATPMYNKASEIRHLLNILILNDVKDDKSKKLIGDIFTKEGVLKKGGDVIIRKNAQKYVSYMRGENPYTFPLRLRPSSAKPMIWPKVQKVGSKEKPIVIEPEQKAILEALPLIHVLPREGSAIHSRMMRVLREGNPEDFKADTWVHLDICNIVYPNGFYGHSGWDSYFTDIMVAGDGMKYRSFKWSGNTEVDEITSVDDIFSLGKIKDYAPKMGLVLERLQASRGISFVYSRYVKAGILPLAVGLERMGWTRVFSSSDARPVYTGKEAAVPRQCAFCELKENTHKGVKGHAFAPACYVMLTGDVSLTPNFAETLSYASQWPATDLMAPNGGRVKAILGSQITTEGLDLKCVRSIHILDPWYHLNRLEQIIGRGIRFCSHADLPPPLRNCLIYMYALTLPKVETPDLHAYRLSAIKAKAIGVVQREMKIGAFDCNLNIAGLLIRGAQPRKLIDAEGKVVDQITDSEGKADAKYDIKDKPHSSICDYMDTCEYECSPKVEQEVEKDSKTYTYSDARRRLAEKEARLKMLYSKEDIAFPIELIRSKLYNDLPWEIVSQEFVRILEDPAFRIVRDDGFIGRLILQNGYLLFQPYGIRSKQIPLAYRYSRVYNFLPRTTVGPRRGSVLGDVEAAPAESVESGEEAVAAVEDEPISSFIAWMTEVDAALSRSKTNDIEVVKQWHPPEVTTTYHVKAWGWLLFHFRAVPEIRLAAAAFWVERAWTVGERKLILEKIVKEGREGFDADLLRALEKDMFTVGEISGYKIVNTTSFNLESFCYQNSAFETCPSSYDSIIDAKMGKAVDVKAGTGDLFGFLVPRKDNTIVFKTLDKNNSKRIMGAVGADCSVASDLGGHRGRVRDIQEIIRRVAPELKPLMINDLDTDAARDAKGRPARQESYIFKHIDDLSHIYVCIYMETLLRLMDYKKYNKTRWFLNAVEASRAGLKGR
jgi:Type III restriction enzyme, res subunit